MKKYIAIVALCFMFSVGTQAQVTVKPGLRAGVNFSRFSDSDLDMRTDFYAGGFIAFKLTRFYSLQPELTYSRQGARSNNFDVAATNLPPTDIKVSYLSVGMMNKITFNDQFCIMAGPTMDFETYANIYTNSNLDLGITGGFGYTLPFGVTLEARAKFGIVDVLESDFYNNSNNRVDNWNANVVLQLGLSYSFDVKGTTK